MTHIYFFTSDREQREYRVVILHVTNPVIIMHIKQRGTAATIEVEIEEREIKKRSEQ